MKAFLAALMELAQIVGIIIILGFVVVIYEKLKWKE
jgi:hypothetical protein